MNPIENAQESEVVVDEIDANGGWLVRHHTVTKTYDERIRLDSIAGQLAEKQAALTKAQQELDAIIAVDAEVKKVKP